METKSYYSDYLASAHWKNLRKLAFATLGNHCHCCGSPIRIQLHHLNYSRGWAGTTIEDLIPLCSTHHNALHRQRALDYLWPNGLIPNTIKRTIALRYLRHRQIINAENASTIYERISGSTARKPREYRKSKARVKPSANPGWAAGRASARFNSAKNFGWL